LNISSFNEMLFRNTQEKEKGLRGLAAFHPIKGENQSP
jgi:hypothetical protein